MMQTTPTYYKVLNVDGSCYHGGVGMWPENEWMPALDPAKLTPCKYGYHILEEQDLVHWLGPAIAPVEVRPQAMIIRDTNKLVVAEAKRGPLLTTWNDTTQRLFAADCAEHVLRHYTDDSRAALAIQAARDYARGLITKEQLAAAHAAAVAAAHAAAYAAVAAVAAAHAADAAVAAARAAAYAADAYNAAERQWQTKRLMAYLNGELS